MVNTKFGNHYRVQLQEEDHIQILKSARDYIHAGHTLLSHPLAGSVKPNETPYKSMLITTDKKQLNFESVKIIEESIQTCEKFATTHRDDLPEILADFQFIDCSLIESAIASSEMR